MSSPLQVQIHPFICVYFLWIIIGRQPFFYTTHVHIHVTGIFWEIHLIIILFFFVCRDHVDTCHNCVRMFKRCMSSKVVYVSPLMFVLLSERFFMLIHLHYCWHSPHQWNMTYTCIVIDTYIINVKCRLLLSWNVGYTCIVIESREEFKDHHIELRLTNTSNFDINFFREKKKKNLKQ